MPSNPAQCQACSAGAPCSTACSAGAPGGTGHGHRDTSGSSRGMEFCCVSTNAKQVQAEDTFLKCLGQKGF